MLNSIQRSEHTLEPHSASGHLVFKNQGLSSVFTSCPLSVPGDGCHALCDVFLQLETLTWYLLGAKHSNRAFYGVRLWLLLMAVCARTNYVNQINDSCWAATVHTFFGHGPVSRDRLLQTHLSIVVDTLHGIAEKPETETVRDKGLCSQKSVHEWPVGVLALIDQKYRVQIRHNVQQWRLLDKRSGHLDDFTMV
ncbi:hypothetical protein D3C80_1351120 [compost metagenome]